MPLTIASVLGFIPTNLWRSLKKFVTRDTLIVFDTAFKLSTKYTPGLLMVMMCLSFANQFVRNIEIDCAYGSSTSSSSSATRGGYNQQGTGGDTELNDFCWNHDTFLVAKALRPESRSYVTYPGVSGYDRGKDTLIRQRYYKQVWLILGKMCVLCFLPYFFWKLRGFAKIRGLVEVTETEDATEDEVRVTYYLETLGFNGGFAVSYLVCKILATVTMALMWIYLTGFMGRQYKLYGVDVLKHFMDESDPWPNPMDVLFPKMAKCEWARYGHGGDVEVKSAQCQLPMNNMTQWSFFLLWWWIPLIFILNALSTLRLFLLWIFPCYRRAQYSRFVHTACRQDVEKARTYTVHTIGGQFITRRYKKSDIVKVHLTFGDWLVLSFLKRNLQDWQFREFIKKLVVTENHAIQLQPMPSLVAGDDPSESSDSKKCKGEKGGKGDPTGGSPSAPGQPPPIGFILPSNGMGFIHPPPTYSACGTDDISPTSTPHNGLNQDGVDSCDGASDVGMGNTSQVTLLCNETTINITPPVKINRSALRAEQQRQAQLAAKQAARGNTSAGNGRSGR